MCTRVCESWMSGLEERVTLFMWVMNDLLDEGGGGEEFWIDTMGIAHAREFR